MAEEAERSRDDPGALARALCRSLAAIADQEMRARALGRRLADHEPALIAAILAVVIEESDRREPGADLLVKAMISPGLRVAWDERLASRVMAHAREAGRYDLAAMFLEMPPLDARLAVPAPRLARGMSKVPLGVRRAMARRGDMGLLEHLLADPDPQVVEHLLNNPRLTQQEVVTMAARSPVREEVLAAIAGHPRWGGQHRVRLTLALNPATPTGLALGLLHLLLEQDLRAIAGDPRLSRVVAGRAAALLGERAAPAG